MSFSILPKEIKFEILNYLSIGSRYNASLVWQETMDETRRFIPTNEEVMEMLKIGANEYSMIIYLYASLDICTIILKINGVKII